MSIQSPSSSGSSVTGGCGAMRPLRLGLGLVLAAVLALPGVARALAPANDAFADAQVVTVPASVTGTNVDATLETGEPPHGFDDAAGASVWYRLTATATQTVRIDACASAFAAAVAVYRGDDLDALERAGRSDGACAVVLDAEQAATYRIAVAGQGDATGAVALGIAVLAPPANDAFAAAQRISMPDDRAGTNVAATAEAGEPDHAGAGSTHSVWYRLALPAGQPARLDTCESDFDTVIAVYTGSGVGTLSEVAHDDDGCELGSLVDVVSTGAMLYIAVAGYGNEIGEFKLSLRPPPVAPPPPSCPSAGSPPGAVAYAGTHSVGGSVCLTVLPTFAGVASFQATDAGGDVCNLRFVVDRFATPLAISDRSFSTPSGSLTGAFSSARGAQGLVKFARTLTSGETCTSPVLAWSASTTATPPWALPAPPPVRAAPPPRDVIAPLLRVRAAKVQRPLRQNGIVVLVRCPAEACTASASTRVARVRLAAAGRRVAAGAAGRRIRLTLSARARRALRSALRSPRRRIKATVTVVAADAAGNRMSVQRRVTLRR